MQKRKKHWNLNLFKTFYTLCFVLFLLLTCSGKSTPIQTLPKRFEIFDISYPTPVNGDSSMTKLDVYYYIPDGQPKKLMVFILRGSWIGGDKSNLKLKSDAMIQWFLDRGVVVAEPNFRLASKSNEPQEKTYREQPRILFMPLPGLKRMAGNMVLKKMLFC